MNGNDDLERRLARHMAEEPPHQAPDRVLLGALTTIQTTKQRRRWRAPWRTTQMFTFVRYMVVAGLAAILFATVAVFPRSAGPGQAPEPSPSPLVSPPAPLRTFAVPLVDTGTWLPWVSDAIGYSISYPPDWTAVPMVLSTDAAASPPDTGIGDATTADQFLSTDPKVGFTVGSEPLGDGQTFDQWLAAYQAEGSTVPTYGDLCYPALDQWAEVNVDGRKARVLGGPAQCYFTAAVVEDGGRVYHLTGVRLDTQTSFDRGLFLSFLSTVQLHAETVPAASGPAGSVAPN